MISNPNKRLAKLAEVARLAVTLKICGVNLRYFQSLSVAGCFPSNIGTKRLVHKSPDEMVKLQHETPALILSLKCQHLTMSPHYVTVARSHASQSFESFNPRPRFLCGNGSIPTESCSLPTARSSARRSSLGIGP